MIIYFFSHIFKLSVLQLPYMVSALSNSGGGGGGRTPSISWTNRSRLSFLALIKRKEMEIRNIFSLIHWHYQFSVKEGEGVGMG